MDTRTGLIVPQEEVDKLSEEEKKHFKPVAASVMVNRKRMRIRLNEKCGCGSGRKFKNCCYSGKE
ncbi:MAG: SEC-C metal-binding domain-containing protein [Candidatus Paceibacterota bacterium]|jgi:uncharacterized protein YchJ